MPRTTAANNKTQPTSNDVATYLDSVPHNGRREDAYLLLDMMTRITAEPATLWGPTIIGFGRYHYVYDSGREGDHFLTGFAPRKANMVVYIVPGFEPYGELLEHLGPYKTGRSCLYLGRLSKIDVQVLEEIITLSVALMKQRYKLNE
ncbi:MAG: DUF1801 domain-containing protein [bacterium]